MAKKKSSPKDPSIAVRTLRVRLKDKHAPMLKSQAGEVNFVWNFCNETSMKVLERERRFCTAYELDALTAGATKEGLSLHSQTVQAMSAEYVTRRKQFKKRRLSWRSSKGARRSLGWIPFKASAIAYRDGQVRYQGAPISLWDSYGLKDYRLGAGSFSEDARGRWYMNVTVEVKKAEKPEASVLNQSALGIDLGLKDLMAGFDGFKVEAQSFYRDLEPALAVAQRAGKKDRTQAIHAKISNRRKDFLHKLTSTVAKSHAAVFVGDVNAAGLAKTKMAKSVLDSGWSTARAMLSYKCEDAGVWFKEVNERYSTPECSHCHQFTGPKGPKGLNIRQWTCVHCLTSHDRDVNAAINIRNRGLEWLQKEFPIGLEARADEPPMNKDSRAHSPMAALGYERPAEGIPCL